MSTNPPADFSDPLPLAHEADQPVVTGLVLSADDVRKADFMRQVVAARAPKPPEPTPPPPTSRQLDQTAREIAKGQERTKRAGDQERQRPAQLAPGPNEPHTTQVFRPHEYQHESKNAVPFKG